MGLEKNYVKRPGAGTTRMHAALAIPPGRSPLPWSLPIPHLPLSWRRPSLTTGTTARIRPSAPPPHHPGSPWLHHSTSQPPKQAGWLAAARAMAPRGRAMPPCCAPARRLGRPVPKVCSAPTAPDQLPPRSWKKSWLLLVSRAGSQLELISRLTSVRLRRDLIARSRAHLTAALPRSITKELNTDKAGGAYQCCCCGEAESRCRI
ncbi:hypothetical protein GQ55_3G411900 [Panicum hallii var. hallii]|uniref:Uncharacterized protein n=1 Tax=Panicum hallii var. hallii TaxID=1504633 RepID=A0A2T7EH75_9POAL|nr:hypothetical protein GQ55_3G411900 [Panicum hallii var. hallii]